MQGSYAPNTDKQPVYTKKCTFLTPVMDFCFRKSRHPRSMFG